MLNRPLLTMSVSESPGGVGAGGGGGAPCWLWCATLCARLEALWRDCSLCDTAVLLADDSRVRPAHACVLAAASPVLRAALTPAAPGCFSLRLDLPAPVWDAVVLFVYTGRLQPAASLAEVSKAARLLHLEELERLCDAPASPAPKEASVTPHHPDPKPADAPSDAPPGGGDAPAPERGAEGQQKAPFGSPDSISAVIDRLIHYEKSASDPEYGGGGGGAAGGFPTAPGGPPVFPFPSLMDAAAAGAAGADAVRVSASLAGIGLEHDGATEAGKAVAAAAMRAGYPPVTPGPSLQQPSSGVWRAVYQPDGTFRGYEPCLQSDPPQQDDVARNGPLPSAVAAAGAGQPGPFGGEAKPGPWVMSPTGGKVAVGAGGGWLEMAGGGGGGGGSGGALKQTLHCRVCGKGFTRARSLSDHERTHSSERPHACATCGKTFTLARYLACHEKRHLAAAEKGRVEAEGGGGGVAAVGGGEEHAYECATCAVCFTSAVALARHNAAVHAADAPAGTRRPHECATCGKSFAARYLLAHHERTHSGERPFACQTCGKAFARADILSRHAAVHTGARPHTCGACGKAFSRAAELACHRRAHTGERPFACYACGARFANSSSLCRHRRVHTGARPHACDVCGRGFAHRYVLRHHERTHTGERPYACDVCGRAFTRNDILARHKTTHITPPTDGADGAAAGAGLLKCGTCDKTFAHRGALLYHERTHALLPPAPSGLQPEPQPLGSN